MHYLITGGCGFIGSHLVERLLADGHSITILDDLSSGKRDNVPAHVEIIEGDITTPGIYDALLKKADGCFHLAAIASVQLSEEQWLRTHQVNLGGTVALFDAIARSKKPLPVVFASSAAVYGDATDIPLRETTHCQPRSSYGADKLTCEFQARVATYIHRIPTIGLRFFNVYGERQDPNSPYSGVISIFAKRMKANAEIIIHGDGEQSRDFIYVGDIVEGLCLAMEKLESKALTHGIFNLCTGVKTSVNQIASTLAQLTGTNSKMTHGPARSGDTRLSLGDTSLSRGTLGFKSTVSLKDGLTKTLRSL